MDDFTSTSSLSRRACTSLRRALQGAFPVHVFWYLLADSGLWVATLITVRVLSRWLLVLHDVTARSAKL